MLTVLPWHVNWSTATRSPSGCLIPELLDRLTLIVLVFSLLMRRPSLEADVSSTVILTSMSSYLCDKRAKLSAKSVPPTVDRVFTGYFVALLGLF